MARRFSGWAIRSGWAFVSGSIGPTNFQTLEKDRVAKGFNVVQIVAGLDPSWRLASGDLRVRRFVGAGIFAAQFGD
jgi:hypothetical protein